MDQFTPLLNHSAIPRPPWCVAHRKPLGECDECGSTFRFATWTSQLGQGELMIALAQLLPENWIHPYNQVEQSALIREAIHRLA